MAMTHTFELEMNGTNLDGEIDLSKHNKVNFALEGEMAMNEEQLIIWQRFLLSLSICFDSFGAVKKLEIKEL